MLRLFFKQTRIAVSYLVLLAIPTIGFAQTATKFDSLDIVVQDYMQKNRMLGFAACIVKDEKVLWSKGYGLADVGKKLPMSVNGIMNIGSISKTIVATSTLQLWEKKLINLDADINEYLPFKVRNPKYPDTPITVFQILTHTTSIRDGSAYGRSYACGDPVVSLEDWIRGYVTPKGTYFDPKENFHDWAPGVKDQYSNVAFGVLGLIVEKVSKLPLNEYCKTNIFQPLGMKNTGWFLNEIDVNNHIRPYVFVTAENKADLSGQKNLFKNKTEFNAGDTAEYCLYSFPNYPDGLVRTSVTELSHFLTAMMNGGKFGDHQILKKETIEKMLSVQTKISTTQGLCWQSVVVGSPRVDRSLWGHSGGDPGVITYLIFDPVHKIGVITFQNNMTGGALKIINKLFQLAERN